jgi:hypothetical protein
MGDQKTPNRCVEELKLRGEVVAGGLEFFGISPTGTSLNAARGERKSPWAVVL